MKKKKKKNWMRPWCQAAFFALTNGYATGFMQGKIYKGTTKAWCVPGLNCYSCPGAMGSCPIGALQAVLNSQNFKFSCFVLGIIMAFGTLCGRFICGWLCPFGLVQDLLHKIPLFKKEKNMPGHKYLNYLKYVILAVFVILLPLIISNAAGMGEPWFCEYICPSGTLLGGIPLVVLNSALRSATGFRFAWKVALLLLVIILSIKYYRPFCKYVCPLGAMYGFFNPVAFYRYQIKEDACVNCGACTTACKMGIDVRKNPNSFSCIRCGDCKAACPTGAIVSTWEEHMHKRDDETLDENVNEVNTENSNENKEKKTKIVRNILLVSGFLAAIFTIGNKYEFTSAFDSLKSTFRLRTANDVILISLADPVIAWFTFGILLFSVFMYLYQLYICNRRKTWNRDFMAQQYKIVFLLAAVVSVLNIVRFCFFAYTFPETYEAVKVLYTKSVVWQEYVVMDIVPLLKRIPLVIVTGILYWMNKREGNHGALT